MDIFTKNGKVHLEKNEFLVILNKGGICVDEIHVFVPSIDRWIDVSSNQKAQTLAEEMLGEYLVQESDKDDTDFSYKDDENYKGAI